MITSFSSLVAIFFKPLYKASERSGVIEAIDFHCPFIIALARFLSFADGQLMTAFVAVRFGQSSNHLSPFFQFVILSTAVVLCSASYGGGGGGGYGYHPIEAAIYSNHHTSVYPVPSTRYAKPTYVDVPAGMTPVYINFQSQSSPVYVKQQHYGMSGSYQVSIRRTANLILAS